MVNFKPRTQLVETISSRADYLKGPLTGALVNCLSSEELASYLDRITELDPLVERALFRTLSREGKVLQHVLERSLDPLLARFENAQYHAARTLANVLRKLAGFDLQPRDRRRILSALLDSRFVSSVANYRLAGILSDESQSRLVEAS